MITYVDPERHPWNSVKFQSKGVSKLSTSSYFDVYPYKWINIWKPTQQKLTVVYKGHLIIALSFFKFILFLRFSFASRKYQCTLKVYFVKRSGKWQNTDACLVYLGPCGIEFDPQSHEQSKAKQNELLWNFFGMKKLFYSLVSINKNVSVI